MVAPASSALAVPPSPASSRHDMSRPALPSLKTLSPGRYSSANSSAGGSSAPSPTQSNPASRPQLSLDLRSETRSIDSRSDKRLPQLPSPLADRAGHGANGRGWALGAYDNKLVSSTLSQLPPIPPLSPGGMSTTGSQVSSFSTSPHAHHILAATGTSPNFPTLVMSPLPMAPRTPSQPQMSSHGVLVLPDGTKLPNIDSSSVMSHHHGSAQASAGSGSFSGPNSPWSLLTVHVLPLFAGSPLKTPIEDLNALCNQHIVGTSQRTPTSRLIGILTNDLREFIASGMLTLKAKFEALEEGKVVSRTAEVWNFFWGQILPYVQGVFLPFSQVRDVPLATSTPHQFTPIITTAPIAVRQILLSAFLVHILLPLLPRLISLVSSPRVRANDSTHHGLGATDLPRLLQMSLVLSTQARYTAFFPTRDFLDGEARDEETRDGVEDLGRAVRWSMAVASGEVQLPPDEEEPEQGLDTTTTTAQGTGSTIPSRPGLQRGPSVSQAGRLRRRGLRSGSISQLEPEPQGRMVSQGTLPPEQRWGRPRIDEDDGDDVSGIGHGHHGYNGYGSELATPQITGTARGGAFGASTSTAQSTVRAAESFATFTDQRTPAASGTDFRRHARPERAVSSGESDLTNASSGIFSRRKH